ncbi:UDP-galactopyranose mutase [Acidovorax sp. Leaf78]|uniref:UDP-galactopyranose mutase n=1 Tax=unclassified Acidovorax TaxID=2684926 RepID=UPI0006F8A732|nr:UDP-galactopyranose mutase [Acidovorax sp. Leaf78]KQO15958.1 UDP-galactopyranose mutase [Acidovorax sp. Leaf78]
MNATTSLSSDAITAAAPAGFDYLIVGAGFAGSVLAERLANAGHRILVVEKRSHIAGNAYDHYDDAGVLVHPYGPHIFHTNSEDIFDYLSRFTAWRPYEHRVLASVDGQQLPIPINLDTINQLYGLSLTAFEVENFFQTVAETVDPVKTSEDVVVNRIGRELYNKFFRGYTRKQWGLDPSELDASVTARVPTRTNRDDRYFSDKFQAMPLHGYTRMFARMLDHPNIKLMLNTDYREVQDLFPWKHMIYTGPVDAFFDHRHGKLPYRSIRFEHTTVQQAQYQDVGTVNYPNDHAYTRTTEFKHITGQVHPATSIVREYPCADGDPYYPIPRPANAALYKLYEADAEAMDNVTFVGRLATYRYYNMDQVVGQSLATFKRLQEAHAASPPKGEERVMAPAHSPPSVATAV